jgi:hypothetical protein
MDILIYQTPDGRQPDDTETIVKTLTDNPLPGGYIYTLVSYLDYPPLVRVQAMDGAMSGPLDAGERVSATGTALIYAIPRLCAVIKQQPCYCPGDKHDYFDGYYGVQCHNCDWFATYGSEPWLQVDDDLQRMD